MTKQEFVSQYRNQITKLDVHFKADLDDLDQGLSVASLEQFLDSKPGMLEALTIFRMSGENLANIVEAIGGAEMYEFTEIPLLEDIRTLASRWEIEPGTEPDVDQGEIKVDSVRQWMRKRGVGEVEAARFAKFWAERGNPLEKVAMDFALGGIILARHIETLQGYNYMLPGGDDTYFDYYPGEMYYYSAVVDWFLSDGLRSC